jgi:flagellar P-ring protein precursor FlgI
MLSLVRFVLAVAALAVLAQPAAARSRIKDIVSFEGIRGNYLTGVGLVVGLAGTGDSLRNIPQTKQSLQSMLERLGINTRDANIDTKNVAFVNVTAELPPFAGPGSRIDVKVAAVGDAKSLLGGTLVMTTLQSPNGDPYAVAQGQVQTGAISASGASGSSVSRGVPTAGMISNGALVERANDFQLSELGVMHLTLHNPDFTTAQRVAQAINAKYPGMAVAENPTIVAVKPPNGMNLFNFVTAIEQIEVDPDNVAKVTVSEVSGVVVIGQDVRISTVAIAQGNLTISVQETPQVSQPQPFSQGQTTVTSSSQVKVDEEKGKKLIVLKSGASLSTLVKGLNALGVTPRDLISILQAIKAQGALQGELEVI